MYKHLKNKGFEHFIVYEDGRVQNTRTGNFITGDLNNCGYHRVQLFSRPSKFRVFVHRLVAMYFVEGYVEGLQVNHIDGNKLNNHFSNLEWVTQSENEQHKQKFLKPKVTNKEVIQFLEDGSEITFFSVKDCAKYNGVDRHAVSSMLVGKRENKLNVRYKTVV